MAAGEAAVWFLAEARQGELAPPTFGLAAEARRLARRLECTTAAVLAGPRVSRLAPCLPADRAYVIEHPSLSEHIAQPQAALVADLVRRERPSVLLLAATPFGSDLAPRLAARLGTGLAPGCLRLDLDSDGVLLMVRPAFGGRASCTVVCPSARPQMATLLPDALPARAGEGGPPPEVIGVDYEEPAACPPVVLEGVRRLDPDTLDVGEAEVLVAGGRGMGGPEPFRHLRELATLLGGTVAASRPAVDAGWAPYSRQVGTSGKLVAPRLYIACGISGASQHVVGMRDSAFVVVVNPDPYAPIAKMADLALVGDATRVIPALVDRLRAVAEPPEGAGEATAPAGWTPGPQRRPTPAPMGLSIAVCLSTCLDPECALDFRSPSAPAGAWRLLNPVDRHALEEALRLRDSLPGSRVTTLTLGSPDAEPFLREALAVGVDDAVLLWDDALAGGDSLASARALAAAVRRLAASIVLCGSRNPDGYTGQLPLQMAELLGWPGLARVVALSAEGEAMRAECRGEGGRRSVFRAPLPALFAVEPGINRPRYAPLRRRLQAAARPVPRWGLRELGLRAEDVGEAGSPCRVLSVGPPKPVAKGLFVPDESLSAEERWQQLLGGGKGESRQQENVLHGPPERLAEQLLRFLMERGFVRERRSRVS